MRREEFRKYWAANWRGSTDRVDFFVGYGEDAEWIGSVINTTHYHPCDRLGMFASACREGGDEAFRRAVGEWFDSEYNVESLYYPQQGWPWPEDYEPHVVLGSADGKMWGWAAWGAGHFLNGNNLIFSRDPSSSREGFVFDETRREIRDGWFVPEGEQLKLPRLRQGELPKHLTSAAGLKRSRDELESLSSELREELREVNGVTHRLQRALLRNQAFLDGTATRVGE